MFWAEKAGQLLFPLSSHPSKRCDYKGSLLTKVCFGKFIVCELVEEVGHIIWATVAEIDIVAVFPNVEAEKGFAFACCQRIDTVWSLGDGKGAVGLLDQPCPTRAELGGCCRFEICLELFNGAECFDQLGFQLARDATAIRGKGIPEMNVVPVLASLVEDAGAGIVAIGQGNDFFEGLALQISIGVNKSVQGIHIGLMMLVVVKLEGFLAHASCCECGIGIGKSWKFKCHWFSPLIGPSLRFREHPVIKTSNYFEKQMVEYVK